MKNMEKKQKRKNVVIIFVSIIGLGILFSFAYDRNTFPALAVGVLLLIFFCAVLLQSSVKALLKKDLKNYLSVIFVSILGIAVTLYLINYTDQDLRELNEKRRQVFQELRPVFLKYKKENNTYPKKLSALVPKYIKQIPSVLVNDKNVKSGMEISYRGDNEHAEFWYHSHRGPDSSEFYSISKDQYEHQD